MEFAVLGHLEVRRAGVPLDLGTPLQRALLALLVLERGRAVSVDRIVDSLWPAAPPDDPEASVQTYVFRLRRLLEPARPRGAAPSVLVRAPLGYRLAVGPEAVDAERFERLAGRAREAVARGSYAEASAAGTDALALWRGGEVLPELAELPFVPPVAARLGELRLACEEDRLAAALGLARHREALPDLELLAAAHPQRERLTALLMAALHRAGRAAEALDRYARARAWLDGELGLEPGPELREVQARILRQEPDGLPAPARPAPVVVPESPAAGTVAGTPLVGRGRELVALRGWLGAAGPRFAVLEGEAGIGKTRLAEQVAVLAEAAGLRTAWAGCHEDDDTPALWPWRRLLAALPGDAEEPAGEVFPALDLVLTRLRASDGPLLLVLDDVQWADPASLRLLAVLAGELRGAPVAVLATCRSGEGSAVLSAALAALARTPGFLRLALPALAPAESAELARALAGGAGMGERRLADLHERSGGNPFFVTELARLLADEPDAGAALPAAVRDTVERRLARLPEPVRPVLRLAAVAGARFDLDLLLRAGTLPDDVLLPGLDAAVAAGLLVPDGAEGLRFAHALVRDAVLAGAGDLERRRLHATIAGLLPPDADAAERAHHLLAGRPFTDAEQALRAALTAGEQAAAALAWDTAAGWYERALAVPGTPAGPALPLTLGRLRALAGRRVAAQQAYAETVDAALAGGDAPTAAAAAEILDLTSAGWFWTLHGEHPEALLARLAATDRALGTADSPARARVLGTLAVGAYYAPDPDRREETSAEALAMARRLGDPALLAHALVARLAAIWQPGRAAEQVALADELLAAAPEGFPAVVALLRRCVARLELARPAGIEADLAAARRLATGLRLPALRRQLGRLSAALATARGEFAAAEEAIDRGSVLLEPEELPLLREIDGTMRTVVLFQQGRLAALADAPPPVSSSSPDPGHHQIMALAAVAAGRPEQARALVARHDLNRAWPPWWDALVKDCLQAELAAELGDRSAAATLADRLAPHAGELAVYGTIAVLGPVAGYLGRVEALAGRPDAAEAHLRQAVGTAERLGFRPARARALHHLAGVLADRGADGEARAAAGRARELAAELGMLLPPTAR